MQIIDELETSKRGMYGGLICRLDFQGNLDSCIAIRMAVLNNGIATVRTGAGIVYDSNPQAEANETRQKAQAVLQMRFHSLEEGLACPILIVDPNYDSFTYNLYQSIAELHHEVQVIRNDKITVGEIEQLKPSGVILSPGPGRPGKCRNLH